MSYPTSEEKELIMKYAMLPYILDRLEEDILIMRDVLKTSGPYVNVIQQAIKRIELDIIGIRKSFRESNIKMYEEERTDQGVELKYNCRGYHHVSVYKWDFLKGAVDEMISKYLSPG